MAGPPAIRSRENLRADATRLSPRQRPRGLGERREFAIRRADRDGVIEFAPVAADRIRPATRTAARSLGDASKPPIRPKLSAASSGAGIRHDRFLKERAG